MILRKPYAFFIKQFKTIHLIMSLLIAYLIYRTTLIMSFFNEYLGSIDSKVDPTAHDTLFNTFVFLTPVLIILMSILILWIFILKKKPFVFYVTNIIIYIYCIFALNHSSSIIEELIQHTLHLRTIRLARDFLIIAILFQLFALIKCVIYATGFDIKKFNFGQDLAELEIDETDDEEFEFDVEVDTNKINRDVRRRIRFSKYVYVENRFLINIILALGTGLLLLFIYFNQNIYNKVYDENIAFFTQDFTIKVNRSFVTKKDAYNKKVSSYTMSFVIVELDIKNNSVQKKKLDIARAQLLLNNKIYYHKFGTIDLVSDIGNSYGNEDIPNDFTKYLLVYEVPDKYLEDHQPQFRYLDTFGYEKGKWIPKYVKVNLYPRNLDNIVKTSYYNLGDEISFENSILGQTSIRIDDFKVARQHKLDYIFCVNDEECYDSYEYIKPDIFNVHDKTIMYLNGSITWDEELAITPIVDVFEFINKFAKINYEVDGQLKQQTIELKKVKPQKVKKTNNYYIEVVSEIERADKIYLIFNIRDMTYIYKLE
ncbi:MAG: hypothetical protein GX190_01030 [Mollicutes bacterium]|mgnify:CR=1 FL=1|nr:hypothetical protein [Mollicutes bacterium]